MVFNPKMLLPAGGAGTVTAISDPFGNSYGYSTANQADPTKGYNPTFDLWSTSGLTTDPPGSLRHDHPSMDQKLVGRGRRRAPLQGTSPLARVHHNLHSAIGALLFN